jgi:hypothetical protein
VERLVEGRDRRVPAVDGQGVLDEVVRPDAQKIDLFRDEIRGHRGRRGFDHGPQGHVRAAVRPRRLKRRGLAGQDAPHFPYLVHRRDEGQKDAQVRMSRGTEHRAELRHEDLGALQAQAQAAKA